MKLIILLILLSVELATQVHRKRFSDEVDHIHEHDENVMNEKMSTDLKMRCTRRYTPGHCPGAPVRSVWTYLAFRQNCTERLGCPPEDDANRYCSYQECLTHCRQMNTAYLNSLVQQYKKTTSNKADTPRVPASIDDYVEDGYEE